MDEDQLRLSELTAWAVDELLIGHRIKASKIKRVRDRIELVRKNKIKCETQSTKYRSKPSPTTEKPVRQSSIKIDEGENV